MISTLPSVLTPSIKMYSRLGYSWSNTERMVCSINGAWLREGVTTVIRGHAEPSGMVSGAGGVSAVQGQPVWAESPGGNWVRCGDRIAVFYEIQPTIVVPSPLGRSGQLVTSPVVLRMPRWKPKRRTSWTRSAAEDPHLPRQVSLTSNMI